MTRDNRTLLKIAENMRDGNFEGSFFYDLAMLMLKADNDNRQRLANAFPEPMARYQEDGEMNPVTDSVPVLVSCQTFRSKPYVNIDDDMVRVTIDMTYRHWCIHKKKILAQNAEADRKSDSESCLADGCNCNSCEWEGGWDDTIEDRCPNCHSPDVYDNPTDNGRSSAQGMVDNKEAL